MKTVKTNDSDYFIGKSNLEENGVETYLVFQPMQIYFKRSVGVGNGSYIYYWKSKKLSDERINSIKISDYGITPQLSYLVPKIRVAYNESCLKQDKVTFNLKAIISIYTVYEISRDFNISTYPTQENCLFGAFSLAKHVDIYRYNYSGYRIGFDRHEFFSLPSGETGKNLIIFGVV